MLMVGDVLYRDIVDLKIISRILHDDLIEYRYGA